MVKIIIIATYWCYQVSLFMWKSSQHLFEVLHSKCLLSTKFACVKDCLGVRDVILHDIEAVLGWNYSKNQNLTPPTPLLKGL